MVAVPLTPGFAVDAAVMIAVPGPTPVTMPDDATEATLDAFEVHVTVIAIPGSPVTVALSATVPPTVSVLVEGLMTTERTVAAGGGETGTQSPTQPAPHPARGPIARHAKSAAIAREFRPRLPTIHRPISFIVSLRVTERNGPICPRNALGAARGNATATRSYATWRMRGWKHPELFVDEPATESAGSQPVVRDREPLSALSRRVTTLHSSAP
jgi:hypothetical protein